MIRPAVERLAADGIACVARTLADSGARIATLATPIDAVDTLHDPAAVKLVRAANGDALYFSRAAARGSRGFSPSSWRL